VNDRLVWIDCEMTGLDLGADALIEVAALVTDFDLNVLGEGVDLVIKPPAEALDQMDDFVRDMHEKSGLLEELDGGITLAEAEEQVLAYIREHCPDGSRPPLAGNTVATDRAFLARDMPTLEAFLHYRIVDVSSIKELSRRWFPRAYFQARPSAATTARWPTSRRASRSCATTARPSSCPARPRQRHRQGDRASTAARSPGPRPPRRRPPGPDYRFRRSRGPVLDFSRPRVRRGRMVGVAQLVERRVVVADVAGSSPVTHPTIQSSTSSACGGALSERLRQPSAVTRMSSSMRMPMPRSSSGTSRSSSWK
jgi:oligoribonuclease (3'-5' exoribonuclease)